MIFDPRKIKIKTKSRSRLDKRVSKVVFLLLKHFFFVEV